MIKKTEKVNLRQKSHGDLVKDLDKYRKELFNLRFKQANGNLKSTHYLRFHRRKVALIKTLLTEKQCLSKGLEE